MFPSADRTSWSMRRIGRGCPRCGWTAPSPDYVVHPASPDDIAGVLKIANVYRLPVVPWGGGSGTQGGAAPVFGGILLDLKRLDRILAINPTSLTVTAEAGVIGAVLEQA